MGEIVSLHPRQHKSQKDYEVPTLQPSYLSVLEHKDTQEPLWLLLASLWPLWSIPVGFNLLFIAGVVYLKFFFMPA